MSKLTKRPGQSGEFEYRLQETPTQQPKQVQEYPTMMLPAPSQPYYPSMPGDAYTGSMEVDDRPQDVDWDLLELVKQSSKAPVDDTILQQMEYELNDIEAKLTIIAFLKNMEKALRKRAKVLNSFIDKLEEARDELISVGANTLEALTPQQISKLQDYISDESLDTIAKMQENITDKHPADLSTKERLSDFDVE